MLQDSQTRERRSIAAPPSLPGYTNRMAFVCGAILLRALLSHKSLAERGQLRDC